MLNCLGYPAAIRDTYRCCLATIFISLWNLDSWIVWLFLSFTHSSSFFCNAPILIAYRQSHQNLDPKSTTKPIFLIEFSFSFFRLRSSSTNAFSLIEKIYTIPLHMIRKTEYISSQHVIVGHRNNKKQWSLAQPNSLN